MAGGGCAGVTVTTESFAGDCAVGWQALGECRAPMAESGTGEQFVSGAGLCEVAVQGTWDSLEAGERPHKAGTTDY